MGQTKGRADPRKKRRMDKNGLKTGRGGRANLRKKEKTNGLIWAKNRRQGQDQPKEKRENE